MTSQEILKADVLDILFDNRNKMYGAYALRRYYNNRLGIALGVMLSSVLICMLLIRSGSGKEAMLNLLPEKPVVELTEIDLTPPREEPEPARTDPAPAKQLAQVDHQNIQIVPDNKAPDTEVPPQSAIINAVVSNATIDGEIPSDASRTVSSNNSPGNGQGTGIESEEKKEKDFTPLERKPEFPGGEQAWFNFLRKHLNTPEELEAGEKRTVLIQFTVGHDGSISKFEILKSAGEACDREVIRVLRKMPKWKPAIQNGHNVSVVFTQPVTFMAFED